jgi:hypothetical protein
MIVHMGVRAAFEPSVTPARLAKQLEIPKAELRMALGSDANEFRDSFGADQGITTEMTL